MSSPSHDARVESSKLSVAFLVVWLVGWLFVIQLSSSTFPSGSDYTDVDLKKNFTFTAVWALEPVSMKVFVMAVRETLAAEKAEQEKGEEAQPEATEVKPSPAAPPAGPPYVKGTPFLHLVVQYYLDPNPQRRRELNTCFYQNLLNPLVEAVHLLAETQADVKAAQELALRAGAKDKLVVDLVGRPLNYSDAFTYTNTKLAGKVAMVTSADIRIAHGFEELSPNIPANMVLAPSRYGLPEEKCGYPDRQCDKYQGSHDTFIFVPPLPVDMARINFRTTHVGAENALLYELIQAGNTATNPCLTLILHHMDCLTHRSRNRAGARINRGTNPDGSHGPVRNAMVYPETLQLALAKRKT
mmetsp:Transcript_49769/g.125099  ORF Transcript_49769/g.125099 Transcript_49769/m.125099 type:complete len:356 (-) Transcript_49769:199-1266(-)|eukprot:CAMPEP_0177680048 /NCGR_PEP_ID=MMETSP0447-20121125/29953_1 /TAXON_ID=0 /ORGANISM="Stygamoeba regulata, Strain BSH-02190019" /LENGTH=355 /DNA_ID=CAMNT_0019189329 /DNA_START=43 /DNA_END=1110 /DNA_ORIENTATION=-